MEICDGHEERRLFEAKGDNEQLKDIMTVALHTECVAVRYSTSSGLIWIPTAAWFTCEKQRRSSIGPMNGRVREVFNKQKRSSEYVFTSAKTNRRLIDVKKAFNTARLEAGIPDFQLRDLRHSCATRLSDRGEELVTIAEILGHTDIRMTKRYSPGMQERKREALEKLVSFTSRQNHVKNLRKQKRQGARPALSR